MTETDRCRAGADVGVRPAPCRAYSWAVRRTLGLVAAVLGVLLAAPIMAEYEFEGLTPWLAGLAVGVLVGEAVGGIGRWRGRVAMAACAVISAAGLLWGEWLESDRGLESWAVVSWGAAAFAALVAAANVRTRSKRLGR